MLDNTKPHAEQVNEIITVALGVAREFVCHDATTGTLIASLDAFMLDPVTGERVAVPPEPLRRDLDLWRSMLVFEGDFDSDALWQSYGDFIAATLDKCQTHRIDPVPQATDLMYQIARDCGVEKIFGTDAVQSAITEAINNHELVPDLLDEPYAAEIPSDWRCGRKRRIYRWSSGSPTGLCAISRRRISSAALGSRQQAAR